MDVAVLNPRLDPPFGGASAVCYYIVETLQEKGNEVDFYSGADRGVEEINERFDLDLDENLEMKTVDSPFVHDILDWVGRGTVLKRCIEDRFFLDLAKDIEDEYDLIILGRHVFDADIEFEKPVLQYVHDHLPGKLDKPGFYKKIYGRFSTPGLFSGADINLYNSEYIASNNPQSGRVVYPPVDSSFNPGRSREDRAVILGRIAEDKNMEEAIEIVSNTDLDLCIIGSANKESEYFRNLHQRSEDLDWLSIEPNVSRKKLRDILETSRIGISCKREENFGINVVEYMKAGLLPMVYNNAGPAEIVRNNNFSYESIEEASRKIEGNLQNEENLRDQVIERSEDFGVQKFKEELLSCIEDIT